MLEKDHPPLHRGGGAPCCRGWPDSSLLSFHMQSPQSVSGWKRNLRRSGGLCAELPRAIGLFTVEGRRMLSQRAALHGSCTSPLAAKRKKERKNHGRRKSRWGGGGCSSARQAEAPLDPAPSLAPRPVWGWASWGPLLEGLCHPCLWVIVCCRLAPGPQHKGRLDADGSLIMERGRGSPPTVDEIQSHLQSDYDNLQRAEEK